MLPFLERNQALVAEIRQELEISAFIKSQQVRGESISGTIFYSAGKLSSAILDEPFHVGIKRVKRDPFGRTIQETIVMGIIAAHVPQYAPELPRLHTVVQDSKGAQAILTEDFTQNGRIPLVGVSSLSPSEQKEWEPGDLWQLDDGFFSEFEIRRLPFLAGEGSHRKRVLPDLNTLFGLSVGRLITNPRYDFGMPFRAVAEYCESNKISLSYPLLSSTG